MMEVLFSPLRRLRMNKFLSLILLAILIGPLQGRDDLYPIQQTNGAYINTLAPTYQSPAIPANTLSTFPLYVARSYGPALEKLREGHNITRADLINLFRGDSTLATVPAANGHATFSSFIFTHTFCVQAHDSQDISGARERNNFLEDIQVYVNTIFNFGDHYNWNVNAFMAMRPQDWLKAKEFETDEFQKLRSQGYRTSKS